jgi:hypothetical protein
MLSTQSVNSGIPAKVEAYFAHRNFRSHRIVLARAAAMT